MYICDFQEVKATAPHAYPQMNLKVATGGLKPVVKT